MNTRPYNQPGEHRLALFLAHQNHTEFFDSYGYPPSSALFPESIMAFLNHNATDIAFQRKQLQHPPSTACTYHYVFFLHHHSKGLPFEQISKLYSNNLVQNDQMLMHFGKYEDEAFLMATATQTMFQKTQTRIPCSNFHKCVL